MFSVRSADTRRMPLASSARRDAHRSQHWTMSAKEQQAKPCSCHPAFRGHGSAQPYFSAPDTDRAVLFRAGQRAYQAVLFTRTTEPTRDAPSPSSQSSTCSAPRALKFGLLQTHCWSCCLLLFTLVSCLCFAFWYPLLLSFFLPFTKFNMSNIIPCQCSQYN